MKKDWKYYLGMSLFIYSFFPIIIVALLPFMGLTLAQAGAFAVVFLASGEISFYISVALMGKEFLALIKKKIFSVFKRKYAPKPISKFCHILGLTFLGLSFLPYYVTLIYLLFFKHMESDINFLSWTMVLGEIIFIIGMFTLGGQFWDKIKNLFIWSGDGISDIENATQPCACSCNENQAETK